MLDMIDLSPIFANLGVGREISAIILFIIFSLVFEIIFKIILKTGKHLTKKTKNGLDDEIIAIISKKTKYLSLVVGGYLAIYLVYGNIVFLGKPIYDWFLIGLLVAAGSLIVKLIEAGLDFYMLHIASKSDSSIHNEIIPMAKRLIVTSLYIIIIVILLSQLGIDISPLIAGLGIGGLAIGLALQDTLSNFFSGLHIIADRPIKAGNYIKIVDKGIEGYVKEINWRTSRILALGNNLVIIPNKDLANSIIINYDEPSKETGVVFTFGVGYGTDINKVYSIIRRIIKELEKEKLIVVNKKFKPWWRVDELGDFSINFKVGVTVPNYIQKFAVRKRFLELIYKELNKAKIDIPFPTQTIYLKRES